MKILEACRANIRFWQGERTQYFPASALRLFGSHNPQLYIKQQSDSTLCTQAQFQELQESHSGAMQAVSAEWAEAEGKIALTVQCIRALELQKQCNAEKISLLFGDNALPRQ